MGGGELVTDYLLEEARVQKPAVSARPSPQGRAQQPGTSLSSAGEQPQWVDLKVGGVTLTGDRMLHHTGTVR